MRLGLIVGFVSAALCGVGLSDVRAETLPVEGIYAAGTDAPSRAQSIAISGFGGREGERVAFAIDTALRNAIIEGRPYFDVTFSEPQFGESYRYDRGADPVARRGGADAVMRGIAEVEVDDVDSGTKEVEECTKRDDRDKCIERTKVPYPCRTRTVELRPEVRLVGREGDLLYAMGDTLVAERRFCKDEKGTPPVDMMVQDLANGFAAAVRSDLAPVFLVQDIRVLENRDGIAKADHAAFRAAIRQTKDDIEGACRAFAALEASNPRALSVLFNIGLCHESAGELEAATRQYEAALAIKRGKIEPREGLDRIASRFRAEQQLILHEGSGRP
ncbi:tetratricopeptide repeat protein [Porphyrobacter sp. ULC335]|uniref:tetratricopeptide repeat protein n=1 Tax=Porphyrobacter sp. ULC335 TaxID=2854260 RepID=UPI00221E8FF1|nr:hypothetical protein [Porphyrobacter sp. ULC335]UYV14500.1 hypothetical protein KVF90_10015 [Porphyrobacter sp. ULC335]